jgi:hypothetical protein
LIENLSIPVAVSCEEEEPWVFGHKFTSNLKLNKMQGLSGQIEIDDKTGYRKNNILSIVDKSRMGVDLVSRSDKKLLTIYIYNLIICKLLYENNYQVGFWRESSNVKPIEIVRSFAKAKDQVLDRLKRFLIVSTKLVI